MRESIHGLSSVAVMPVDEEAVGGGILGASSRWERAANVYGTGRGGRVGMPRRCRSRSLSESQ
ncbi:hypothetical protein [Thiorhodococcus drewsii]|uniref:hypothetical protein n=1 Tax=Thiorhodococcus drewsii TaxID=210408 RepID=UPI0011126E0E|nr:hypothetical protein [Thiorhodococcus drewsii]